MKVIVKFIYSEKATKFCKIFPLLLIVCTVVKSKKKISQNFVAFSEYMNFKRQSYQGSSDVIVGFQVPWLEMGGIHRVKELRNFCRWNNFQTNYISSEIDMSTEIPNLITFLGHMVVCSSSTWWTSDIKKEKRSLYYLFMNKNLQNLIN